MEVSLLIRDYILALLSHLLMHSDLGYFQTRSLWKLQVHNCRNISSQYGHFCNYSSLYQKSLWKIVYLSLAGKHVGDW